MRGEEATGREKRQEGTGPIADRPTIRTEAKTRVVDGTAFTVRAFSPSKEARPAPPRTNGTAMQTDPLSDVLQMVRPRMAAYDVGYLRNGWGIRMHAVEGASFFVVETGQTLLGTETVRTPLRVRGGDVVLLAHGEEAWLKDEAHRPLSTAPQARPFEAYPPPTPSDPAAIGSARNGAKTAVVIAGIMEFERPIADPLLRALPPTVHLSHQQTATGRWLARTIGLLDQEIRSPSPGRLAIVAQIFGMLFMQTLRALAVGEARSLPDDRVPSGLLRGLRDPSIARALHAFHHAPSDAWSVQKLADAACTSRTAFATRFKKQMGVSPMQYVRQHRMRRAALLLKRDPSATVTEAAWDVGYESPSSFIKAFQREMGCSPTEHRGPAETSG